MGTWSDTVEGRGVAHSWKKGARDVEAKAKSRTEGLAGPLIGKRVKTPGVLSSEYPRSEALEKYGKKAWSSEGLWPLRGPEEG